MTTRVQSRDYRALVVSCPRAFTLMEIVVAMGIFMVASLVVAQIFVNVQRAEQRLRDNQIVATELRYLLDVMSREIRSDKIDYAASGCAGSGPQAIALSCTTMNLLTGEGVSVSFSFIPNCFTVSGVNGGCVQIRRGGAGVSWQDITSHALSIDSLTFYATPLTDPFPPNGATASTPDVQPRVTMVLKASSLAVRPQERVAFYLQTSTTSRTYAR